MNSNFLFRLHRHLTHLSLKSCPLITDRALEAIAGIKKFFICLNYSTLAMYPLPLQGRIQDFFWEGVHSSLALLQHQ